MRIMSRVSLPRPTRHELALIGITMIWGATFLVVHLAVQTTGPWFFVGVRFAVAALVLGLLSVRVLRGLTRTELIAGASIGLAIALGYGLQTVGLQSIESSTSAFITAFYVPLVPLLQWAVFRRAPRLGAWLGIAAAFVGLLLLAAPELTGFSFGFGEVVTLVSAFAIAAEVVLISVFANRVDARRVTVVQLVAASLFAFVAMPVTGEAVPAFSGVWVAAAVGLGVASALIQLTMNWAQRRVTATRDRHLRGGAGVGGRRRADRGRAAAGARARRRRVHRARSATERAEVQEAVGAGAGVLSTFWIALPRESSSTSLSR